MIADDSAPMRKRLVALLGNIGNVEVVSQAEDAVEAIAGVRRLKPDVVILDIRMPGGGGLGVLDSLRREKPGPMVIMLTDYPFAQYRRKCLETGANFFFDKAAEFYRIPEAFEQLLAGGKDVESPERSEDPPGEPVLIIARPRAVTSARKGEDSPMDAEVELLRDRYIQKLSDLYGGETELLNVLPEMIDLARSPALQQAFQYHSEKIREHVERLEQIFAELGESPAGCPGQPLEGLLLEYQRLLRADEALAELDDRLILAARKMERSEISGYLLVLNYAQILRDHTAAALLERTLNEEYEADRIWAGLAEAVYAASPMAA